MRDAKEVAINGRMIPIRVHLGPMPEMLRTIMADLLSQSPDIVIAGESTRADESLMQARGECADVLVTQDPIQMGAGCLDLVLADPPMGIFAVSADGRSASGVTLRRRRIQVESQGRSTLAEAIRQMALELHAERDEPSGGRC